MKEHINAFHRMHVSSPLGIFCLEDDGEAVTAVYVEDRSQKTAVFGTEVIRDSDCPSELLQKARQELEEYFAGIRREFDLPLHMHGTEFQVKVWNALRQIPYGETCSYQDIAERIGNPKACRAVGGANNKNQILILVPCHRVIGKDGSLVGFGGGLDMKEYLLKLERSRGDFE